MMPKIDTRIAPLTPATLLTGRCSDIGSTTFCAALRILLTKKARMPMGSRKTTAPVTVVRMSFIMIGVLQSRG